MNHLIDITTKSLKCQKVNIELHLRFLDEIPIVLLELNESALAFITREQFEKALLLLQKAHGVLDAVDLTSCKRD